MKSQQLLTYLKKEPGLYDKQIFKFIEPYIIIITSQIGRSFFGPVYKGINIKNGTLATVKTLQKKRIDTSFTKFYESFKKDVTVMTLIQNQNIVKIYDLKMSPNNIYVFEQFYDKDTLANVLKDRKKISEAESLTIMKQLINGYKDLYKHSIIHGDLKPESIRIKNEIYKIQYFYPSKLINTKSIIDPLNDAFIEKSLFRAPQFLNKQQFTAQGDMWSMGIIFYQMLFGVTPNISCIEQLLKQTNNQTLSFPQRLITPGLQKLIESMLKYNPEERISWKKIFSLKIFNQSNNNPEDLNNYTLQGWKQANIQRLMGVNLDHKYFEDRIVVENIYLQDKDNKNYVMPINYFQNKGLLQFVESQFNQDMYNRETIINIKNWFLYKHNKAFFLNHIAQKLQSCVLRKQIQLSNKKPNIFLLVFSKYIYQRCSKLYTYLSQQITPSKRFSKQEYKLFLNSSLKEKIMAKLQKNTAVVKIYIDQLIKLIQKSQLPTDLVLMKFACSRQNCSEQQLKIFLKKIIDEIKQICKETINSKPECRPVLQLSFLVAHFDKKMDEKSKARSNDLQLIYEQQKKLSNQELVKRIKQLQE